MIDRLARLAQRRGRRVVIVAAFVFVVSGALGAGVADRLDPYGAEDPDSESAIADRRLEAAGFRGTAIVVLIDGVDVRSSAGRARVEATASAVENDRDVASVSSVLSTGSRAFVSRNGDSTYLAVTLEPTDDRARQDAAERIVASLARTPGVSAGGPAVADLQSNAQVEHDLRTAELYAFPLLFALSLLFFRSLVAALLPLLVGALAIVATFLACESPPRRPRSPSLPSTSSPASGSAWRSITACSSSRATARRSHARARDWRRCDARWPPPGAPCSSAP